MSEKISDSGWKFVNSLANARLLREVEVPDAEESVLSSDGTNDQENDSDTRGES